MVDFKHKTTRPNRFPYQLISQHLLQKQYYLCIDIATFHLWNCKVLSLSLSILLYFKFAQFWKLVLHITCNCLRKRHWICNLMHNVQAQLIAMYRFEDLKCGFAFLNLLKMYIGCLMFLCSGCVDTLILHASNCYSA